MHSDLLDRERAESLVDAILAVDGVAALDGGQFGEVAMLFPGARIRGVHVSRPRAEGESPRLEVNLVASASDLPNLEKLAADVRDVALSFVDVPVDVTVVDVA